MILEGRRKVRRGSIGTGREYGKRRRKKNRQTDEKKIKKEQ